MLRLILCFILFHFLDVHCVSVERKGDGQNKGNSCEMYTFHY